MKRKISECQKRELRPRAQGKSGDLLAPSTSCLHYLDIWDDIWNISTNVWTTDKTESQ